MKTILDHISLHQSLRHAEGQMKLEVDFHMTQGEVIAIMGPSGSGKTSILRMIAGLMKPEKGMVSINGETWVDTNSKTYLPPQKRSTGFVFQDYALFPHMSIRQNIMFALSKKSKLELVDELLTLVQLQHLQDQKPERLSGGQKQRIALARALAREPRLLLLDEPLAALDKPMRIQIQQVLKNLLLRFKPTTILVSHDPGEVARLASRVLILDKGKVIREGSPAECLSKPLSLTNPNIVQVLQIDKERQELVLLSENEIFRIPDQGHGLKEGDEISLQSLGFQVKKITQS